MSKRNLMLWRVDSDLFKNNRLRCHPSSLCILFGRVYLTDAWAADHKTHRTHKKPYNGVMTAASIAASKDEKIFACRADLRCCCVYVPEIPVAATEKLLRNFCVVRRSRHLVICSNTTLNKQVVITKHCLCDVCGVVCECLWIDKSELRRSCCRNAQIASLCRITQHQLLRLRC